MKLNFILLILIIFSSNIVAQNLSGRITDKQKNSISAAHILNLNTGNHTHSDEYGSFSIETFSIGDTLRISHIGYKTEQVIIKPVESPLSIILELKPVSIEEVVISPKVNALNMISEIDIQTNPVNSSQDILRQVPGLIIGQHAGGGKAEQMFLRGFDIDHGTDITITADGLPVNMVSHAHGQGYADLHFVIPETIENIDFGKGPYFAHKGNFNTAGYVNFNTKRRLQNNLIKFEKGDFSTNRVLGMFDFVDDEKNQGYLATEYISTDGAFESPQNFSRINLFSKYTVNVTQSDKFGILLSHFASKWDASGQIPQRAVDAGMITRFGSIDDTEGGYTNRTNLLLNYDKYIDKNSFIKNSVFYTLYDFELYSNFTFFLFDSINGDQIRQKEIRSIFGINSEYSHSYSTDKMEGELQAGVSLRYDQSKNNELTHTLNRNQTLNQIILGDIFELNYALYFNATFNIGKWTINPALRFDYFDFQYNDALQTEYETQTLVKNIVSPKLNILYHFSPELQLYIKAGKGFHSNDTRVVIEKQGEKILPAAYGYDLGALWKPVPRLLINTAYWYLFLEQEFVYVGDAGIVEPGGKTKRQGIDISMRYQLLDWLFWNFDANYAHARAIEENAGEDFIPLAPDFTLTAGLNIIHNSGLYGGLNLRHINDRPANEDNSIVAKGYSVVDFNIGYPWRKLDFGIQIQNLLNTEWNETQFATETRLKNEPAPVEEIHFIPGTPFFLKGIVTFRF